MADRLALQELLAGTSRACNGWRDRRLAARDAAQPPSPSPLPLLSLHALPCFPTGNWTITTSAALKMEPSERCAIWRSCELILRLLPCVCERECVCTLCREERGSMCAGGGPCGCFSGSSAAMLLKSGTGRSLRLTLAKVFAGCKV